MAVTRAGILILADKSIGTEAIQALFEVDYNVYRASDIDSAIRILESQNIDFVMMDASGKTEAAVNFIANIKHSSRYHHILVGVTHDDMDEAISERLIKAGAGYTLEKPLNPALLKMLVDNAVETYIDDRNEDENRRIEELSRVNIIADTMSIGLIVVSGDVGGVIEHISDNSLKLLGHEIGQDRERLKDSRFEELVYEKDRSLLEINLAQIKEDNKPVRFTARLKNRNGQFLPYSISIKNVIVVLGVTKYYLVISPSGSLEAEEKGMQGLKEEIASYKMKARLDPLTGIYNKNTFFEETTRLLRENTNREYVVSVWDIDRFKAINEMFGADTGDRIIIQFADYLKKRLDPEVSTYGRIESDHFVTCCSAGFHRKVENDIKKILDAEEKWHSLDYTVYMHVGMYRLDPGETDIVVACDRATMALQTIKDSFINRINYFTREMRDSLLVEQQIVRDSEAALLNREFIVVYQPIVDSKTKAITAAEALVRWRKPGGAFVSPGVFIPTFEKNGFVSRLDRYIWEEVCTFQARRISEGKRTVPISVNFSRVDFYNSNLYEDLISIVNKYGLDHRHIKVEVTESAYMDQPLELMNIMNKFRSSGYQVLMDDFGSGFSSLNMLKDFEVDILKIDMKFMDSIDTSERAGNILYSIIQMAKIINMQIVAEGVETVNQYELLKNMDCDCIQGYYFFKPLMESDFIDKLDNYSSEMSTEALGKGYRILLLSSGISEEKELSEIMKNEADITIAESCEEAQRYLEKHFGIVNLIILDFDRKYEDADRFAQILLHKEFYVRIPVILFASNEVKAMVAHYIKNGFLDAVSRPFNDIVLRNRLVRAIEYYAVASERHSIEIIGKSVLLRQQMNSFFEDSRAGIARVIVDKSDDLRIMELAYVNDRFLNIHGLTLEKAASKEKLSDLLARAIDSDEGRIDRYILSAIRNKKTDVLKEYYVERFNGSTAVIVSACSFKYMADVIQIDFILIESCSAADDRIGELIYAINRYRARERDLNIWRYNIDKDIIDQYSIQNNGRYLRNFEFNASKNIPIIAGVDDETETAIRISEIYDRLRADESYISEDIPITYTERGSIVHRIDRVTYYRTETEEPSDRFAIGIREDVTDEYEMAHRLWREKQYLKMMSREAALYLEINVSKNRLKNTEILETLAPYGIRVDSSYDDILRTLANNSDENDRDKLMGNLSRKALIRSYREGKGLFKFDFMGKSLSDPEWAWYEGCVFLDENEKTGDLEAGLKFTRSVVNPGIAHIISEYDSLTGLYSRVMFEKTVNRRINENWAEEGMKAFVLINIDEFKMVNDMFGHNVGDSILKTISKIVINELGSGAIVGRLGGDEFVGFVPRLPDRGELEKRLSALNENTRYEMGSVPGSGNDLVVTTSIGAVFINDKNERFNKLYSKANMALRQVKQDNKGSYRIYDNPL